MLRTGVMPKIQRELTIIATATGLSIAASLSILAPAHADWARGSDPNMGHFYMGRQQIQITDDTPIVNYKGGDPAQQQQQNPALQQTQKRPVPLPRAGFTGYTPPPTASGFNPNLPSVENGVPRRELPAAGPALDHGDGSTRRGPKGKQAKAGSLKPGAGGKQATANSGSFTGPTKSYAPYKGYDPSNSPISSSYSSSYSGGNSNQVKTKVRGSLNFGRPSK